jgi:hypothetical protein
MPLYKVSAQIHDSLQVVGKFSGKDQAEAINSAFKTYPRILKDAHCMAELIPDFESANPAGKYNQATSLPNRSPI